MSDGASRKAVMALVAITLGACSPTAVTTVATTSPPTTRVAETTTVPPPSTTTLPGLTGKITLWHGWSDAEAGSLDQVVAGFNQLYPEVSVEVDPVAIENLKSEVDAAWAEDQGPTVLVGSSDWAPSFQADETALDLGGVVSQQTIESLNPAGLDTVTYGDQRIGLPYSLGGVVLFRNTQLVPDPPATLDDILAAPGSMLERGFFFSLAHLYTACGGQLFDGDGNPAFASDAGVCWLNLLDSFPGPATALYGDDDLAAFKAGEASFIIDGSWSAPALEEAIGSGNLSIDPWPTAAQGALSGVVQAQVVYIPRWVKGDDLAAAVAFVEYFLGADAQRLMADPSGAGHVPAVAGLDVGGLQGEAVTAFAGGIAQPRFGGCVWRTMDEQALAPFFSGEKDAVLALDDAAAAIEDALGVGECP